MNLEQEKWPDRIFFLLKIKRDEVSKQQAYRWGFGFLQYNQNMKAIYVNEGQPDECICTDNISWKTDVDKLMEKYCILGK